MIKGGLAVSPSGRSALLLDGRRVQIRDLLEGGLLQVGDKLEFHRRRLGQRFVSWVEDDGALRLPDGRRFRSPSRAAVEAAELSAVDGWSAWALCRGNGPTLGALRRELLKRHADDSSMAGVESGRFAWLEEASAAAEAGQALRLNVTELLDHWNSKGRDDSVSERIAADLDNHGLLSTPDFRDVTLETTVRIVSAAAAGRDETEDTKGPAVPPGGTESSGKRADVGLRLGNLASALGGVVWVSPNATSDEAVTLMLLHDFSQLAVMTGPRKLYGAISWKSLASAQNQDRTATLADAIEPRVTLPFSTELIDALPEIENSDFVFVRGPDETVSGIVTAADVVHAYGGLATPFFLIGELDQMLRAVVARHCDLDEVRSLCIGGEARIQAFDDLAMGDYVQIFSNESQWFRLGWRLDRVTFHRQLDDLRQIRNTVTHFNPDPLPPNVVVRLRAMINVLRQYGGFDSP